MHRSASVKLIEQIWFYATVIIQQMKMKITLSHLSASKLLIESGERLVYLTYSRNCQANWILSHVSLILAKSQRWKYCYSQWAHLFFFFSTGFYSPYRTLAFLNRLLDPQTFGWTPWLGDQPNTKPLPKHRTTQHRNMHTRARAHTHTRPCPEQDLNLQSQCSSGRRQYMPQTAQLLRLASASITLWNPLVLSEIQCMDRHAGSPWSVRFMHFMQRMQDRTETLHALGLEINEENRFRRGTTWILHDLEIY
jgi:hypothetical protein